VKPRDVLFCIAIGMALDDNLHDWFGNWWAALVSLSLVMLVGVLFIRAHWKVVRREPA
jgi:hypothetical protein